MSSSPENENKYVLQQLQPIFEHTRSVLHLMATNAYGDIIHPADSLFAELLLSRPISQAAFLSCAQMLLRLYHSPLSLHSQQFPSTNELEHAIHVALFRGLTFGETKMDESNTLPSEDERVYLAHDRVIVEFPWQVMKQQALAPLKTTVSDWAFNRFHRKEWSYPLEAIESVFSALAPFSFRYSLRAQQLLLRTQCESAHLQEVTDLENDWLELEHQEARKYVQNLQENPTLSDGRQLYTHQGEAIKRMTDQGRLVLAHDMGLGKAQPLDAKVLTPTGWKRMGDVQTGDAVINSEGGISRVLGVFPQGEKDIYRVTFGDGSNTECCDDHLWAVNTPVRKRRGSPYQVLSLQEIRQSLTHTLQPRQNKGKNILYKHYIPMVQPVQFPEKDLPLDPYVMGVLIGDGRLGNTSIVLTSADDEIIEEIQKRVSKEVTVKPIGAYSWRLSTGNTGQKVKNSVKLAMHEVGLAGHLSYTKFIPQCYKYTSISQRIELLQGLLDTDGSIREKDNLIEFGTTSQQLAFDVVELVQSLGGRATIRQRTTCFTHKDVKREGALFYRMSICLPPTIPPFKLSRKANLYHPRKKYHPCRAIVNVEYVGKKEAQCILVDAPNHLYITDDYIVTHNTMSSLIAARAYRRPIFVIAPVSTHIPWLREAEALGVTIEMYSWAKLPTVPEIRFVLIGDEAHMIQNLESQRTKAFLALADRAIAVFPVTGTPMKNAQAMNLFPLLIVCKHPLSQDKRAYEDRYCSGSMRRIGKQTIYESTGTVHLDELHEKTRDVILYKKKSECIDLPPKIRILRPAEVTPAVEQFYEETIERLWREHDARIEARKDAVRAMLQSAEEEGTDIDPKLLEAAGKDASFANALVEMGILRHAASLAKVDTAISIAEEVQEQGGSIVIFTLYRDTARQIALSLHADCLIGGIPAKERQAMIDRFQERQTSVLVCTAAGGLGITLTAAQTAVLVERPWTPGDVTQSEDRLHRIGQVGAVTSIWLQYGLMDDRVDDLLEKKQRIIDHVLTGHADQAEIEATGANRSVLSSAREILKSIREDIPLEPLLSQREQYLIAQAEADSAAKRTKQQVAEIQDEKRQKSIAKRTRPGRPRKGGDEAALRKGFEITLDVETLQRLSAQTTNRSAYIERLIQEDNKEDDVEQLRQGEAKLEVRCRHFPPYVINVIHQIRDKRGVRAALEASEAVALLLDPRREAIP